MRRVFGLIENTPREGFLFRRHRQTVNETVDNSQFILRNNAVSLGNLGQHRQYAHKTRRLLPGNIIKRSAGYLLKLTLLISILMIVNSYLVGQLVARGIHLLPDVLDDVRLYQFFQIFLPILMVGAQFWIYDRLKDRWLTSLDPESE